ncbi:MAG: hypothetical protein IID51_05050 [Proteobacteria bacterium]|nr:hypothetical protein [Pseudomonadota bacterium]
MHSAVYKTVKKDEMAENPGKAGFGGAKPPASRASECDQVIDSVKKAIGAAELSDHLNADLKEALVQALKRELAELEQLDPDAPLNPSALGAPAQHMISIFEGHSL